MSEATNEQALEALREVLDPETGINLVDLGLIYEVKLDAETRCADVLMTLTSPACPAGEVMVDGIERRLSLLPGVAGVDVRITFDPPWTPERITPTGRAQLGW